MNKPLLLALAAAALVLAALAGLTRQSASAPESTGSPPAAEPAATDTIPFTQLIGERCTAWVAGAGGGGEAGTHYAHRVGGIWTVNDAIIAVGGTLESVESGWARFRNGRDEETWLPLTAIVALQRDVEIRAGVGGLAVSRGPGIHILPPQTGHDHQ